MNVLQVVPPIKGNHDNVARAFRGIRNASDQDVWLIGLDYSDHIMTEVQTLAEKLKIDLDDQVYFYYPSSDSNENNFTIVETYLIQG